MKVVTVSQLAERDRKRRRSPYLTVLIRVSPLLAGKVCRIRDMLRKEDPRQIYSPSSHLHVTVKVLGWLGEEIRKRDLYDVLGAVGKTAAEQPEFELAVEGIGVFPDVIYGKVGAGSQDVRRLNAKLAERLGSMAVRSEFDGSNMIPHVTMAHFATPDVGPLLARAARLATKRVGSMTVTSVEVRGSYPRRLWEKTRPAPVESRPFARFRLGGRPAGRHDEPGPEDGQA